MKVLATAVTTFLAHIFADVVTSTSSWRTVGHAARDSAPILTSGIIPAALLLVARIALVGIVADRLRTAPVFFNTVLAGVALALLALIIVVTMVVLTH